jgi:hypothetical protein
VAAALAPTAVPDALLQEEYKTQYADPHRFQVRDRWDRSTVSLFDPLGLLLDTSVLRPGNLGVAAGGFGGQVIGFGNPYAAAAAFASGPIAYEMRDRVKAGVPAVLAALGTVPGVSWNVVGYPVAQPVPAAILPGPALFNSLVGADVAYRLMTPKPLPIEAYRPTLMKDLLARNARELAVGNGQPRERPGPDGKPEPNPNSIAGDVNTFIEEVSKLSDKGKAKDTAAAQKFVAEFAARRGLKVTESQTPRSEWNLEEEPALAPLLAAQRESLRQASGAHAAQQQSPYVPFGERFFWTTDFNPLTGARSRNPATGRYVPMVYPTEQPVSQRELSEKKPEYVVWRTEEKQAATRSETAAWDDVKKAWKWQQARKEAKTRAEQIANAIRGSDKSSDILLVSLLEDEAAKLKAEAADPKARERVKPFLIRGVCPLTTVPDPTGFRGPLTDSLMPTPAGRYQDFRIVPSENIKYPTQDIVNKLMEDRTKGPKTTAVLADAGKNEFYVSTLLKREVKSTFDYQFDVVGLRAQETGGTQVLGRFQFETHQKALRSVLGLLRREFNFEATDEQKKRLEESARRGTDEF